MSGCARERRRICVDITLRVMGIRAQPWQTGYLLGDVPTSMEGIAERGRSRRRRAKGPRLEYRPITRSVMTTQMAAWPSSLYRHHAPRNETDICVDITLRVMRLIRKASTRCGALWWRRARNGSPSRSGWRRLESGAGASARFESSHRFEDTRHGYHNNNENVRQRFRRSPRAPFAVDSSQPVVVERVRVGSARGVGYRHSRPARGRSLRALDAAAPRGRPGYWSRRPGPADS
jgi:hypothetical protein